MKFSPTQATATRQPHLSNVFLRALQTGCTLPLLALSCLLSGTLLDAQSPAPAPAVAPEPAPPADNRPQTVISSDELDMVGGDEANHFYFRGNVKVQATNMIATCDELEVISARQPGKDESDAAQQGKSDAATPQQGQSAATVAQQSQSGTSAPQQGQSPDSRTKSEAAAPNIGSIREIIMRGNVVISQEGRRATAGVAHLYPQEGRVVLAENPLVTDAQGTLSGWRMELYRGERKVRILSNPDETQRTRVTLPALQDLGYGVPEEPASTEENATTGKAEGEQEQASEATGAPTVAESSAPSQSTGQTAATSAAAPTTSTSQATTNKTESKAEEKAEPAPSRRSGGWNPVNRR